MLQVVAAQLFQHPFRPGNEGWQKESTTSFYAKKKKKDIALAQQKQGFTEQLTASEGLASCLNWRGKGNQTLPPAWHSSAILETLHWCSRSRVWE